MPAKKIIEDIGRPIPESSVLKSVSRPTSTRKCLPPLPLLLPPILEPKCFAPLASVCLEKGQKESVYYCTILLF